MMKTKKLTVYLFVAWVSLLLTFPGCASERPPALSEADSTSAVCSTDLQAPLEISAKLSPSDMIPRIPIEGLKRKIDDKSDSIIVDTRSQAEYDLDHIRGAICIPLASIAAEGWTLPVDKELIFYCA